MDFPIKKIECDNFRCYIFKFAIKTIESLTATYARVYVCILKKYRITEEISLTKLMLNKHNQAKHKLYINKLKYGLINLSS